MIIYSNRGIFMEAVTPIILGVLVYYYLFSKDVNLLTLLLLLPFLVYAIVKLLRYAKKRVVIIVREDVLIIRGIFKTISVTASGVQTIELKKNFYCKIFDWNLLCIRTKDGVVQKIYTPEFNIHQFNKYLNT